MDRARAHRPRTPWRFGASLLIGLAVAIAWSHAAAEEPEPGGAGGLTPRIFDAVVRLHAEVPAQARTSTYLGTQRDGAGIVIDDDGLIVTVAYLVTEATAIEITPANGKPVTASVVGLDNDSGLALVRSRRAAWRQAAGLGRSAHLAERQPVLVVGAGGPTPPSRPRRIASALCRLLGISPRDAIFTAPPHLAWSGAALIGPDGKLLGIGSLIVHDAVAGMLLPGNMFIPIDSLESVDGRSPVARSARYAASPVARDQRPGNRRAARHHADLAMTVRRNMPGSRAAASLPPLRASRSTISPSSIGRFGRRGRRGSRCR